MGITNQQIVDSMNRVFAATERHTAAFTAAIEKLIENDNRHHEDFRKRLEDLALANAAIKASTQLNTEFRKQLRTWVFVVILVPVGTMVLQLIFK